LSPRAARYYTVPVKIKPAMWLKALQTMPRMSREEWDGLDVLSRWLVATRAAAITMSFFSAAIGGLLALRAGHVTVWLWVLTGFGLIMAHATNNLLNDLTDYNRGVDKGNYFRDQYGPQVLQTGFLSRKRHAAYMVVTGVLALASGVIVALSAGWLTWVLVATGALFLLFYTWPLKYIALGELTVFLVWGPLMIGGTYYVVSGSWSWLAVLAGLPYAIGVCSVLVGKHLDKIDMDREKHITTLPVLLGGPASRALVIVLSVLQYAILVYLVATRYFTPVMLLPFISLIFFFRALLPMYRAPRPAEKPESYPADGWPLWYVASAFVFTRRFGGWYLLGLIADTVLRLTVLK
jgi:1,4-dihydroxy-2-naphthoate octaprenyltransferase